MADYLAVEIGKVTDDAFADVRWNFKELEAYKKIQREVKKALHQSGDAVHGAYFLTEISGMISSCKRLLNFTNWCILLESFVLTIII